VWHDQYVFRHFADTFALAAENAALQMLLLCMWRPQNNLLHLICTWIVCYVMVCKWGAPHSDLGWGWRSPAN